MQRISSIVCHSRNTLNRMVMKNGQMVTETVKNTHYLTGMKRELYQNLSELLPSGQAMHVAGMTIAHPVRMMVYSLVVTVVTTILWNRTVFEERY